MLHVASGIARADPTLLIIIVLFFLFFFLQAEKWRQTFKIARSQNWAHQTGSIIFKRGQGKKVRTMWGKEGVTGKYGNCKKDVNARKPKTRHCRDITEEQRRSIFHEMWDVLNWRQKRVKVREQVDKRPVKQKTKIGASRRNWSLFYFLKVDGVRKPVCKSMFLHTVGLREWTVRNWVCEEDVEKVLGEPQRQSKHYTRSDEDRHFLRTEFLEKLPKLPSHYCRSTSSRLYLEPIITSKSQLHQLYTDKCKQEGRKPLSKNILCEELEKMNISIFHPRKDQCDTCVSHDVGNIDDTEYENHRSDVAEARNEKEKDKENVISEEEENTLMITMDLSVYWLHVC